MKFFEKVYMNAMKMTNEENLQENEQLEEMAGLKKRDSGLPVNLWLDDMGAWKKAGHWKRIKFQGDHGDKTHPGIMIPMSIDENPEILVDNPRLEINGRELEEVKAFVRNNKESLLKLSDEEISFAEFLAIMVRN